MLEFIRTNKLTGSPKNRVIVVFDGFIPSPELRGPIFDIEIRYSNNESADSCIRKLLERSSSPKNIIVVSDDREIIFFTKSCRARAMAIEEFAGERPSKKARGEDTPEPQLNYSQIARINQELKKRWLD